MVWCHARSVLIERSGRHCPAPAPHQSCFVGLLVGTMGNMMRDTPHQWWGGTSLISDEGHPSSLMRRDTPHQWWGGTSLIITGGTPLIIDGTPDQCPISDEGCPINTGEGVQGVLREYSCLDCLYAYFFYEIVCYIF